MTVNVRINFLLTIFEIKPGQITCEWKRRRERAGPEGKGGPPEKRRMTW
jgi:hypothetical protein